MTGRFVTRRADETVRMTFETGDTLEGSKSHPIWSPTIQDWVPMEEWAAGDAVLGRDGWITVTSIEVRNESVPLYNLEIRGEHVYEVTEAAILVHNSNSYGIGRSVPLPDPDGVLFNLQRKFERLVETKLLPELRAIDPNLKWGYTGSFRTGRVGNRDKPRWNQRIDLSDFDIDLWIKSDILRKLYGKNLRAHPKFRKILADTPGFEGLRPNKQGFSILYKPSNAN